ncbi:MAG TPA: hydroxysqualene dehydroxylase HpnE [Vicinamibacterales bacterium]|nr:hydroxysqualene dehydroxylase HpnE [Vicinamibacterales bacterium]
MAPDAVVIGGGVAGLAAACALAEAGARVLVLEARGTLGGRATAFRDRETGELVDNGQHVLLGCYTETFRLLRRIGAEQNVRVQPALEVPFLDVAGRRSVLRCPSWPSPFHLLAGVMGWRALTWSDRLRVLALAPALLKMQRGAEVATDAETVAAWLARHGQRGRIREWLWEPLAVAALNQSPEEAAARPFTRVLARMFGGAPGSASLALPTVPLHEMYATPARRFLEARGGEVRLHALARVRVERERVAGVDVRGESIASGTVIASVPWHDIRTLFTGKVAPLVRLLASADALASRPIVTVNLWYDRAVMDDPFVGLPGRATQWVFDKRQAFGERASHLSLVSSDAGALVSRSTADLVAQAARDVAGAIPGARGATLLRGTAVREKHATFSLAPGQPGRPPTRTAVAGLWLAGDWIDTGLPGTIESAALSGHRAASGVQAG